MPKIRVGTFNSAAGTTAEIPVEVYFIESNVTGLGSYDITITYTSDTLDLLDSSKETTKQSLATTAAVNFIPTNSSIFELDGLISKFNETGSAGTIRIAVSVSSLYLETGAPVKPSDINSANPYVLGKLFVKVPVGQTLGTTSLTTSITTAKLGGYVTGSTEARLLSTTEVTDGSIKFVEIDKTAPVFTSGTSAALNENSGANQLVYTATATATATATDASAVSFSIKDGGDKAALAIDATTGKVSLTANPNFEEPLDTDKNNSYLFTVVATDAKGNSAEKAVTLTINDVNEPATISGDKAATGNEDVVITGTLNATDPEGLTDGTIYSIPSGKGASKGTSFISPGYGRWIYTPNVNFNGSDSFTVLITDDKSGSSEQVINVTLSAVDDPASFTGDITATGNEYSAISGTLTATDVEGLGSSPYSIADSNKPSNGTATIDSATGKWNYTPKANYHGKDSFTVTVKDSLGGKSTQAVALTINPTPPTPKPYIVSVAATANGNETNESPVVFTFTRKGSTAAELGVDYQLFGTAQAGSDYIGNTSGSVYFAAGSATATLSLPAIADGVFIDPYETIIARINPATNYEITTGKQFATATITAEGMVVVPKGQSRPGTSSGEYRNSGAFAALKSDGSVISWGSVGEAPAGLTGVSQIFSAGFAYGSAFAALKSDGGVISWGDSIYGGVAPAGLTGVSQIFSTEGAFAALKSDGSVISWGDGYWGGNAPAGLTGVSQIFSANSRFAALKSDGSVISWGHPDPSPRYPEEQLTGVSQIFSDSYAFAALKNDGSVISWGNNIYGGSNAPAGLTGVIQIYSTKANRGMPDTRAFAALKSDGSVVSWGHSGWGGSAPAGLTGVSQIFSTVYAFAALKSDGSVISWGNSSYGGVAPAGLTGVSQIFSNGSAFAALKSDGSVISWGNKDAGGSAPAGLTGVSQIFSTGSAFAALKSDGGVICWGDTGAGGKAPAGLTGVSQIFSTDSAFAALKSDGSVISWGSVSEAPAGLTGVVGFANPYTDDRLVLDELTGKTLDFNGDGNVDTFDSLLMMRHMMGTYPGESIKKDIPGNFDLTFMKRRLSNSFYDTFSLNGGLRLDIDGDKRISAFRDGMMITQHIHEQGKSDSPWAPPGFNPPAGFPAQMQQHLKDLIGF